MAQNDKEVSAVSLRSISESIFQLRKQKVMLNHTLAVLYGIEPRALVQAVKRDLDRLLEDLN